MFLIGLGYWEQWEPCWIMCYPPTCGWSAEHNKNGGFLWLPCGWLYRCNNTCWLTCNRGCSNCSHRECSFKKAIITAATLLIFLYKHLPPRGGCRFTSPRVLLRGVDGTCSSAHFASTCYEVLHGGQEEGHGWTFYGRWLSFFTTFPLQGQLSTV